VNLRNDRASDQVASSTTDIKFKKLLSFTSFLVAISLLAKIVYLSWTCDDALITLRTIDNLLNGYGLRWNVIERVQTYTHPLWLGVLIPFWAVLSDPEVALILPGVLFSALTIVLLWQYLCNDSEDRVWVFTLLLSSTAFIHFCTSGLENSLSHFLAVCFCIWLPRADESKPRAILFASIFAALLCLNRLDFALLVFPGLLLLLVQSPTTSTLRLLAMGLSPLFAWLAFSLVYYGSFVPNTAYAKLGVNWPLSERLAQGHSYFLFSAITDKGTFYGLLICTILAAISRYRPAIAVAFGSTLYCFYVYWIGGDYMGGRFLTTPFIAVVCASMANQLKRPFKIAFVLLIAILQLVPTGIGPLKSLNGIVNEHAHYQEHTGLFTANHARPSFNHFHPTQLIKNNARVITLYTIGYSAFYLGPKVYIVDALGLGDPLMSRLAVPPENRIRVGHFTRLLPIGYMETIYSGKNQIKSPIIASTYETIRLVTQGPIWSWERFRAMWKLHKLGQQLARNGESYRGDSIEPFLRTNPIPPKFEDYRFIREDGSGTPLR
jgi:arabinofuranosyltransferase